MKRREAMVGVVGTVALGLLSRRIHLGLPLWDKSLGDALYAVMIWFLFALARPTLRPRELGIAAFAFSMAIELFQLTGIPARLPRITHLVLGTTFAWHDVACYAMGAFGVSLVAAFRERRYRRARGLGA